MAKISKVIYGGDVLIDLTGDSVTPEKLLEGTTAHGKDGEPITGTCTYDADTGDGTVAEAEILEGKIAYARGNRITGTMPNRGGWGAFIPNIKVTDIRTAAVSIPQGYHDGSGTVNLDPDDLMVLIPANIREGVTILGILGTMSGSEDLKAQSKTVTPAKTSQKVIPDTGYTHLSEVTVNAIPYTSTQNSAGGLTVTIL